MNRLLLAPLLLLGLAQQAEAKCAASGLWAWPDAQIPSNGLIIITAFARSQVELTAGGDRPARLVSKGHSVTLERVELLEGEYGLSELILRPTEALHVGARYELFLQKTSLGKYTVTAPESTPPEWASRPRLVDQSAERFGCGPSNWSKVTADIVDQSAVTVRVDLIDIEAKTNVRFYVHPKNGTIEIGHGMCSGGFNPQPGRRYKVKLVAVDASGAETAATNEIELTAPKP